MIYNYDGKVLISTARMQTTTQRFFFRAGRRDARRLLTGLLENTGQVGQPRWLFNYLLRCCLGVYLEVIGFNPCCCGWRACVNLKRADSYCVVYVKGLGIWKPSNLDVHSALETRLTAKQTTFLWGKILPYVRIRRYWITYYGVNILGVVSRNLYTFMRVNIFSFLTCK